MSPTRVHFRLLGLQLLAGLASVALVPGVAVAAGPDFTRDVRPILSRYCFKCHGPDDAARKARLRLDLRDAAVQPAKSGKIAIAPGKPDESELLARIDASNPDDMMPPPETKQPLTAAQKEILRAWIGGGAEYQQHWAFVLPRATAPPAVQHADWPRNAIDQFVLARLERAGLEPAPAADPYTLVRRLYLDLIGLPPTPEEARQFVESAALDRTAAVSRLVDELLASPRYGERWARRWLDLARYADTNGYEKDRTRSIWPYRDWVVRALNADLPFDRFTIWQLAGDLLKPSDVPPGTPPLDPVIATGFHRNTMLNEEGGIDPLEFRFHAMTDRVATTGAAWLGLTVGCAQCHTHKFDPIPHREYYQFMAFLDNADEPDLDLPDPGKAEKFRADQEQAARLLAGLPDRWPVEEFQWETARPVSVTTASGETGRILDDGSVLFVAPGPDTETVTLVLESGRSGLTQLRLEALPDDSLPNKGPGRTSHGNFVLTEIRVVAQLRDTTGASPPPPAAPLKFAGATADIAQPEFPVLNAIDGKPDTGWAVHADDKTLNQRHVATFQFDQPVGFPGGTRFQVTLAQQHGRNHTLGRMRLALGAPRDDRRPLTERRHDGLEQAFAQWLERERQRVVKWTPLRPTMAKANLPLLTPQPDNSILASGDISKSDTYELKFAGSFRGTSAFRLEALPDEHLPAHGPGLAFYEGPKGDFFLGEFQVLADGVPVKFAKANESYARNNFGSQASAAAAVDGDPQTGWSCAGRYGEAHEAVFNLAEPLGEIHELSVKLLFGRHYACSLGRFRISSAQDSREATASPLPGEIQELLTVPDSQVTAAQRDRLRRQFLLLAPELASARGPIESLQKPPAYPTTLVFRERPPENPRPTFIHKRGEFLQPTERVEPGVLAAVAPFPADAPRDRLGLARWLASTSNPLTARVTVNRQWQAFFGRGLVRTLEDFGFQGEAPSHPELLDWLAVDFMHEGWSLKRLHRLIVTSATYQQASIANRKSQIANPPDPDNRLLWHFPRTRLEAEVIRDSALRVSGLLSTRMGGPGVYPPQPEGITEIAYGSPRWPASEGEDRHRRSLYTFLKRTAPFAMFNTFDAPSGEACLARREASNTPLQALTLLNDVTATEAAQALGRRLSEEAGSVEERVKDLFLRVMTRPPRDLELATLVQFLEAQKRRLAAGELDAKRLAGEGPGDPNERAAWTTLARALLNLDEVVTKG